MPAATFLMRVWLPDRPGVLGAVATRLGSVKGDLLGIEIVERDGGMVVDELLIELPDDSVTGLMLREVGAVEGVRVEDLRAVDFSNGDADNALTACAEIAEWPLRHPTRTPGLDAFVCEQLKGALRCEWVALVDGRRETPQLAASIGDAPTSSWLLAYVAGTRHAGSAVGAENLGGLEPDTFCIRLPRSQRTVVLGRDKLPFLRRDRQKAQVITRVADTVITLHGSPTPDWCCEENPSPLLATTVPS